MKIIENNFTKDEVSEPQTKQVRCEHCSSLLTIEDNDIHIGEFGLKYFHCPCCNEDSYMDESIELTADNVCYPQHFTYMSPEKCVKLNDDTINSYVKQTLNMLDKETDYAYMGTGDTVVIALKSDESCAEANVIVCRNYAETYVTIPYENY